MNGKGHFCYGCGEFFHDSNPNVIIHKGCKGAKSLGICVDSKEFGEFHPYNLEDKSKWELIEIIQKLSKNDKKFKTEVEELVDEISELSRYNSNHDKILDNFGDIEMIIKKFKNKHFKDKKQ